MRRRLTVSHNAPRSQHPNIKSDSQKVNFWELLKNEFVQVESGSRKATKHLRVDLCG